MASRAIYLALSVLPAVYADLPVHCLRHQVVGEWEFTLGQMGPTRSSCGHQKPDSDSSQPPLSFVSGDGSSKMSIILSDPNQASSSDGSMGTFTMIYDEGFEVAINGLNFFAFSKFEWVQDPQKGRTNVSHCGETEVGWYHNQDRSQWGCYFAKKSGLATQQSQPPQTAQAVQDQPAAPRESLSSLSSSIWSLQPDPAPQPARVETPVADDWANFLPSTLGANYKALIPKSAGYDAPVTSAWSQQVADGLNLLQLGWTAEAYSHYTGKTPKEMNRAAGIRRSMPRSAKASSRPSSFLGRGSRLTRASARDPEAMDWRNVNGQSWIGDVITQGDCGSCYTISTVNMLSARNRIQKRNPHEEPFSITFPLYCSEYNQGCDGGYGFLQSKWSEDVGLLPEHCAPFGSASGTCSVQAGCSQGDVRHRATNHHYVGGYYGASAEDSIREELVSGGPVVISFEPKEDFMYYKQGVYKSGPNQIHQEWEQVDHAVLLVGYGRDAGAPYWTMQNSWGADWGENGFFRMMRGQDESGCESIVVSADVLEEPNNQVLDSFLAGL